MVSIGWSAEYELNLEIMDNPHHEFIELLQKLEQADDEAFQREFVELIAHTEVHFGRENALMEEYGFFATAIHQQEHQHVLHEMHTVGAQVAEGNLGLGREYVNNYLPGWFAQHSATMDSALAACIKQAQ